MLHCLYPYDAQECGGGNDAAFEIVDILVDNFLMQCCIISIHVVDAFLGVFKIRFLS